MLTSAHVTGPVGAQVAVFHPGGTGTAAGVVVWAGAAGKRGDAALVLVDDSPHWQPPTAPVRWGRLVTPRPGALCETWGVPEEAQRLRTAVEAEQLAGRINPGTGFVGNQYVMDLDQHPPHWPAEGASPWGGLSGAAVLTDRLLIGVVAAARAGSGHARLNVVPAYVLTHDPSFRAALTAHGGDLVDGLEAVEFHHLTDSAHGPAGPAPGHPRGSAGSRPADRSLPRPQAASRRPGRVVRPGRVRGVAAARPGWAGQDPPRPPSRP
ncbi:hypothetical protein [Kitasatospora cheerisanensis]|uniref:Uncharacterized protein n=1 Tax=Kitasatospora cheerisanensis KCTC 2395 TaxID=1348663 RepID=A0A066YRG0_9ACTN|nr:hypothetical protein [Kitasatospora cheerisanensis]KDN80520.1 hypothetical protein KCH_77540 [Kitasatospora cheerisanensis KCTC 2395]